VIDLKHEIQRELCTIEPPDLWDRIQADAADGGVASIPERSTVERRWRTSPWLAAVAVAAVLVLVGSALTWLADDDQDVDTGPADSGEPVLPAPVRAPSDIVHDIGGGWDDEPLDASEPWADIKLVQYLSEGQPHWYIVLEGPPPPDPADREDGVLIAYGLVLDTTGDGAADYVIGIDDDAPEQGDLHVWVTDLATGATDEQIGPPYGYPIEFFHPSEAQPPGIDRSSTMIFTFLAGSTPAGLDPPTVRFYAWTSATRDGAVFASDYAPDIGWLANQVDPSSSRASQ
jgi:hypothetical protein